MMTRKDMCMTMRLNALAAAVAVSVASSLGGLLLPLSAQAALPSVVPDAGRLIREQQQQPVEAPRPGTALELPAPARSLLEAGGSTVTLAAVGFTGNTAFTQERLQAALGPVSGKSYDFAGLYELADKVSDFYRAEGYPFAKAFVPVNGLKGGMLTIQVVEGRYGERTVQADDARHAAQAADFLGPLKQGQLIHATDLERQILLLGDQPGYQVLPVMKPGQSVGTGDLDVRLTRQRPVVGKISVGNQGNRYTGYYQARANVTWRSPFRFGDQLGVDLLQSDENLQSANLSYSTPIGGNGLRANVGYGHTRYELAREFASLNASGTAQTASAGLSYPLLRSRPANVTLSGTAQHKRFYDEQLSVASRQHKSSNSATVALNFDRSDASGVLYGTLGLTSGSFDAPSNVPDTARVDGRFSYLSADVVRLQRLTQSLSLYARLNAQMAYGNLDGSESFLIGGPYGVRAFPSGEGSGDEGVLTQFEVRYTKYAVQPYVFYDKGRVRLEKEITAPGQNHRSLSGAGVGLRYQYGPWSLDTLMAHRLDGGDPQTDPKNDAWRLWLVFSYAF